MAFLRISTLLLLVYLQIFQVTLSLRVERKKYSPASSTLSPLAFKNPRRHGLVPFDPSGTPRDSVYDFAKNIYLTDAELAATGGDGQRNILLSPLSIRTNLALLYLASKGSTLKEIQRAADFPSNQDFLIEELEKQVASLRDTTDMDYQMKNAFFVDVRAQLNDTFANIAQDRLKSDIVKMYFSDTWKASKTINAFIARVTRNQIVSLVNPYSIDPQTSILLVNALFFSGKWKKAFKPSGTESDFNITPEKSVRVEMMISESDFSFSYINQIEAAGIAIPFKDPRFELLILKPDGDLAKTEFLMEEYPLDQLSNDIHKNKRNVLLKIPKFRLSYKTGLVDIFRKFGIKSIFDPSKADLTGITGEDETMKHFVTNIIHQSIFEIEEKGATASAGTISEIYPISSPSNFILDRPFFFVLNDKVNGPIMIGRVVNPFEVQ